MAAAYSTRIFVEAKLHPKQTSMASSTCAPGRGGEDLSQRAARTAGGMGGFGMGLDMGGMPGAATAAPLFAYPSASASAPVPGGKGGGASASAPGGAPGSEQSGDGGGKGNRRVRPRLAGEGCGDQQASMMAQMAAAQAQAQLQQAAALQVCPAPLHSPPPLRFEGS